MRGRHPSGPEFVDKLPGDATAKDRLRVVLETLTAPVAFRRPASV